MPEVTSVRNHCLWVGGSQGYYSNPTTVYIGDDDGTNKRERAVYEFDYPEDIDISQDINFNFEITAMNGAPRTLNIKRWVLAYPASQLELGASGINFSQPDVPTTNQVPYTVSVGSKTTNVSALYLDAVSAGQPKLILCMEDENYGYRYHQVNNSSNPPVLSYTAIVPVTNPEFFFDHYFDFYNNSPYSRCQDNVCIDDFFITYSSSYEVDPPNILNIFSSNLNRDHYGENNLVSDENSRIRVLSGFDMSSDFTLAIHAFTSGTDSIVFDNGSGTFSISNSTFYVKSGVTTYSRPIPNASNEVDVLVRRLNETYRVYGLTQGVDDYVEFTPPTANTPATNETYALPFVSGNLCELFFSSSGWSDEHISSYFQSKYTLQSHITQQSGYIESIVPLSSGYNEIPLNIVPNNSIKEINPFYQQLNLPATIDYNSHESNPDFYLNLESSSDFNFSYSGQFSYTNGNIDFLSTIPSGINVQTSIPVYRSNNRSLDGFDDFAFNSKVVLGEDGDVYSGVVKFHSLDINLSAFEAVLSLERYIDFTLQSTRFSEDSLDFYTEGILPTFSGVDLYSSGTYKAYDSLDLFTQNNLEAVNNLNFYIPNTFVGASNFNLIMSGKERQEDFSIDFCTSGVFIDSDSFDMFISGVGSTNSSLNLFTYNSEYGLNIAESGNIPEDFSSGHINNSFRMFIGGDNYDNSINLFINSIGSSGTAVNMFIGGENKNSENSVDFLVWNNSRGIEEGIEFFTKSSIVTNSNLNMFIGREYEAVEYNLPFFVKSNEGTYSGIDFITEGSYLEYNTIDLTVSGSHSPNKSINLYSHGF